MPYRYETYNLQDRARAQAAHMQLDAMEADGWKVEAAAPTFSELYVLWYKPAAGASSDPVQENVDVPGDATLTE